MVILELEDHLHLLIYENLCEGIARESMEKHEMKEILMEPKAAMQIEHKF